MRRHRLPPSSLSRAQKACYADMMGVVHEHCGSCVTAREDGALLGPCNAMGHVPEFGRAAWARNKAMEEPTTLPQAVLQVAMLVTGTRLGAREHIEGHEPLAASAVSHLLRSRPSSRESARRIFPETKRSPTTVPPP